METSIVLALISIVTVPLTAWITSKMLKKEYQIKIDKLNAEVETLQAGNDSVSLDNTKKLIEIMMQNVVEPLKKELKAVRNELSKFRKAIEKIPECDYADDCPVKRELRQQETGDCEHASDRKD